MKKLLYMLLLYIIPSFIYSQGSLSFKAEIANKNGAIIYIKDLKGTTVKEIKANDKGFFEDRFDVKNDFYVLYDGEEYTQLYLKNGFDLKLKMDAKNFDKSIVYSGLGSNENNFLAQITIANLEFQEKNLEKNKEDYYLVFEEKKKNDFEKLEKSNFDDFFKSQVKKIMNQEFLGLQMEFKQSESSRKVNGKPAPTFDYVNFNGGKTKLEELKGKYVYIDVWATWCGPCRGEIPFLAKVEEKYSSKKIAFVSISIDEKKDFEKWKSFVKDKNLGGIQLFADNNWNSDFIKSFGINSIPRFILIDPKGNVIDADAERPSDTKLSLKLGQLLK